MSSHLGTHSQADSTVSQAVNISSQAGSGYPQAASASPQAVRASNSSQANSTGSQLGTHSQTDSAVSKAVNNSSQVGSTTPQQGMNAGSTGAQTQACRPFSQVVSSPQAGNTSSQVGSTSPLPGRNVGTQSQAGVIPQASSVSSAQVDTPSSLRHSPPKEERITLETPNLSGSLTYPVNL